MSEPENQSTIECSYCSRILTNACRGYADLWKSDADNVCKSYREMERLADKSSVQQPPPMAERSETTELVAPDRIDRAFIREVLNAMS